MKKLTTLFIFLSALAFNLHGYTISGTAATTVSNLTAGNSSFLIVDTTGGDTLTSSFFAAGVTLAENTTIGDYFVAAYNPVAGGFGTSVPGNAIFNIDTGPAASDDYFYVVAFGTNTGSSVTIAGGNTFGLLSDSTWKVGASNSDTDSFGSGQAFTQFGTINGAQFAVPVPEPSSFALLGGLLALGCVMLRRRA